MPTVTELETQLEVAKLAEKEAARLGEIKRKDEERIETGWRLNAASELHKLTKQVDAVVTEKVTDRPRLECRSLARAFLYGLPNTDAAGLLDRLCASDGRLAGLLGTQRQVSAAQLRAMEHRDGNLDIALDALECKAWAAVAHRIRALAGEI
jgi:hypothetical protein